MTLKSALFVEKLNILDSNYKKQWVFFGRISENKLFVLYKHCQFLVQKLIYIRIWFETESEDRLLEGAS